MRLFSRMAVGLALFVCNAASAQDWDEYSKRENLFTVNFPGDRTEKDVRSQTAKGTDLTAHMVSWVAPADRLLAGVNSLTVAQALSQLPTAVQEAAAVIRAKISATDDAAGNIDQMASWRRTVETPDKHRILAEILTAAIASADTAINTPPPAQFQASVQILDENGVRIGYRPVGSSERVRWLVTMTRAWHGREGALPAGRL
jgi:hypothetical protein